MIETGQQKRGDRGQFPEHEQREDVVAEGDTEHRPHEGEDRGVEAAGLRMRVQIPARVDDNQRADSGDQHGEQHAGRHAVHQEGDVPGQCGSGDVDAISAGHHGGLGGQRTGHVVVLEVFAEDVHEHGREHGLHENVQRPARQARVDHCQGARLALDHRPGGPAFERSLDKLVDRHPLHRHLFRHARLVHRLLLLANHLRNADAPRLDHLPPDFRTALVLREYADMTYQEIADAQGVRIETVKTRIARARRAVATVLEAAEA